jgi:hypothetical protein
MTSADAMERQPVPLLPKPMYCKAVTTRCRPREPLLQSVQASHRLSVVMAGLAQSEGET